MGANQAGRKSRYNRRQNLYNPRGETAVSAIKMRTVLGLALSGKPEDFGGIRWSRHREHLRRRRERFAEVRHFRSF